MNMKKISISGLLAGLASFLVGSFLYMNPLVSGIYAEHGNWVGSKPMESFGGITNWMILMLIGGLISTVFVAFLYSYTEKGIGIKSTWKKGLFFGFLLWLVYKVPSSYYIWLMYSIPNILNVIETINGLVGSIVAGIVMAILFERIK